MKNSDEVDYKALFEQEQKRRRGLQSETDKLKNSLAIKDAELSGLKEITQLKIPKSLQDELDELKVDDPDAWRAKIDEIENDQMSKVQNRVKEVAKQNSEKSKKKQLIEARKTLTGKYSDFDKYFTDSTVIDDVPPKLTKKFMDGEYTAEEYLENAYKLMSGTKSKEPNLNSATGGATVDATAVNEDLNSSYSNTIF